MCLFSVIDFCRLEVILILDQLLKRMLIVDSILISVANASTSDM